MSINFGQVSRLLWGKLPPARVWEGFDDLYPQSLTMGTLVIGRHGSGKTMSLARQIVEYFLAHPEEPIYILDWSGPITDAILTQILQLPQTAREKAAKRLVYDELGHTDKSGNPDLVVPMPEFSELYGTKEEQVERVIDNLSKSHPDLMSQTPIMGGLAIDNAKPFLKLCVAMQNEHGESWQITEMKKLIIDEGLLRRSANRFGGFAPDAKYFIEKVYLEKRDSERDRSVYALLSILNDIEARDLRARFGYYRPGWTPKEAYDKGQMVIVNGKGLISREKSKNYAFLQVFSLILQELKRHDPSDPELKPMTVVLDETYGLLEVPGIAGDIGKLPSQYRSRKLQLFVVLQNLAQLAPPLDEQIWSLGNKIVFGVENKTEAEIIAHQLFRYDPRYEKQPARNLYQNKTTEPESGQDRMIGDWIQNLPSRQCIMRRYKNEKDMEKNVVYVPRTRDVPNRPLAENLADFKDRLLKERAVSIRDALEIINQRDVKPENTKAPTV